MRNTRILTMILCFGLLVQVCPKNASGVPVRASVGIAPMGHFVEKVGGNQVEVDVLVRPGQSPATFEPTPKQMANLSQADVYFSLPFAFEQRLMGKLKDINPEIRLVDSCNGIELRTMTETHAHGEKDEQSDVVHHTAPDPHVWLNPKLVKVIASNVCEALAKLSPEHSANFRNNLRSFELELREVDQTIEKSFKPLKGKKMLVFHPAFGYFADAYGLEQVAIQESGKEPGPKRMADLIEHAEAEKLTAVFVQRQFSQKTAEKIGKEIGARVVTLDPLSKDYLNNLLDMANTIRKKLSEKRSPGAETDD